MNVEQLLDDVAKNTRGVSKGPWSWSHTYELRGFHWCLHNPQSKAEGRTIDAALVLETNRADYLGTPIPELPNARFIAWSRLAVDLLANALKQEYDERKLLQRQLDVIDNLLQWKGTGKGRIETISDGFCAHAEVLCGNCTEEKGFAIWHRPPTCEEADA